MQVRRGAIIFLLAILMVQMFGCKGARTSDGDGSELATVSGPLLFRISGAVLEMGQNELTVVEDDFTTRTVAFENDVLSAPAQGVQPGYPVKAYYERTEDGGDLFHRVIISDFSKCSAQEQAHYRMMALSLEQKVGQMFIVRCPASDAANKAAEYQLGGYILFARDFEGETPATILGEIKGYQRAVRIPMLIGVDEEGGTVVRVSRFKAFRNTPFLSPQSLYKKGGWELIESDTAEKCALLSSIGVNLNLAPVCDVSLHSRDFINARSFGQDAEQTAEFARRVVSAMQGTGVGCVLKHFPGYGNNRDTHTGIAVDKRERSVFENEDFLPFTAGIEAGAGGVLVSHNIVECMDPDMPASLSKPVHDLLRDELGFTGVIMTDDLYMEAIQQFTAANTAAVAAVLAGNDMLCCTDFETQYPAVLEAVRSGEIDEAQINASVERVLKWKIDLGIIS